MKNFLYDFYLKKRKLHAKIRTNGLVKLTGKVTMKKKVSMEGKGYG